MIPIAPGTKLTRGLTHSSMFIRIGHAAVMAVLPVVLSDLILEFSLSGGREGIMSSFISLGALTALVSSIFLQGRVRKSLVIIVACLITSVVLAIIGISRNFTLILTCFFLQGFFLGGLLDAYNNAFIVDLNPGNSERYVLALHGWFGIGGLITPVIFLQAMLHTGWQGVFYLAALIMFLSTLPFTIICIKAGKETLPGIKVETKLTIVAIKEFFLNKGNLILLVAVFFAFAAHSTHILWLIHYMTTVLNSPDYGAIALSCYWVFCTTSRFLVPHIPGKPMLKFTLGMFPSVIFLTFGLLSGSPLVMVIISCLYGLFGGHGVPSLLNECARKYHGATTFPSMIVILSMHVAGMIMPVLIATAAWRFSLQNAILLIPFLALFASLSGLVFLFHQRREPRAESKAASS